MVSYNLYSIHRGNCIYQTIDPITTVFRSGILAAVPCITGGNKIARTIDHRAHLRW